MRNLIIAFLFCIGVSAKAQYSGTITVGGDIDKYYPVTFAEGAWSSGTASRLEIGRPDTHADGLWRGSMLADFNFHTNRYGHGSGFIDAKIIQTNSFIAGWIDATYSNSSTNIIIWLKGGTTSYTFKSLHGTICTVYDGVANSLPFQEENGPSHTFKTSIEPYVNGSGITHQGLAHFRGHGTNAFEGSIGIGTYDSQGYKLAVNGNIRAKEIKVEMANWPDYVFTKEYKLPSLAETEQHIKDKGHLPGIPSAKEVELNGVELGEMNRKLLQKIEELTLHLIQKSRELNSEKIKNEDQEERIKRLEQAILKSSQQ